MKRILPFYIIVDRSYFMQGTKYQTTVNFLENWISDLSGLNEDQSEFAIEIFAMSFANFVYFNTEDFVDASNFEWNLGTHAYGSASYGHMMSVLNKKLAESDREVSPFILLITGGTATDEYQDELEDLWKNSLFKKAHKIGIAVGDADQIILEEFTGVKEAVLNYVSETGFRRIYGSFISKMLEELGITNDSENNEIDSLTKEKMLSELEALDSSDGLTW